MFSRNLRQTRRGLNLILHYPQGLAFRAAAAS
jgi:hypothetical protein